ncbi:MAG: peptidylprolyl isomerase [Paracoccaceae bacterium]
MKFYIAAPIFSFFILFANFLYAKDTFSPAIKVDEMIITQYEIDQRELFFELLKFPGNHKKEAKKSLIDDRLKLKASEKFSVQVTPAALNFEMEMFAKRANLTVDQFAKRLKKAGVDKVTWENYMQIPILWFETVNRRFASEISSSMLNKNIENQLTTGTEIQVLLTEIIIPVQVGFEEEANKRIEELRELKSLEKFSEAAFKYSVASTRELGGKIKWQNLSKLPSVVRPLIAGLSKGEVSEPLPIAGGLAIFQLRDLRESGYKKSKSKFVDYVEFKFKKSHKLKKLLISNVMMCDDLYSFLKDAKQAELIRNNVKENSLSKNLKNILSQLDENEFIFQNGDDITSDLVMVCGRSEKENLSKNDINNISRSLANKRLLSLANSYLENLRQEARIVFK